MAYRASKRPSDFCPFCDGIMQSSITAANELPSVVHCEHCQGSLVPVVVAGFWRRLGAACIDLGLLLLTAGPLVYGLYRVIGTSLVPPSESLFEAALYFFALSPHTIFLWILPFLLLSGLYVGIFQTLFSATLGQRLFRVRVSTRSGSSLSLVRAGIRTLALGLSLLPFGLGFLWIAFDRHKRSLHDYLAGTYVVRSFS